MAHTQSAGRLAQPTTHPKLAASCPSTRDLTATENELLCLMQKIGFGRLEQLRVLGGQPHIGELLIVRDIKLGSQSNEAPRPNGDFALKQEARDFFAVLRKLDEAIVRKVEIRHGLPIHLQIEEAAHPSGSLR